MPATLHAFTQTLTLRIDAPGVFFDSFFLDHETPETMAYSEEASGHKADSQHGCKLKKRRMGGPDRLGKEVEARQIGLFVNHQLRQPVGQLAVGFVQGVALRRELYVLRVKRQVGLSRL